MEVIARGWKRDCGANVLMSSELADGYERTEEVPSSYLSGKLYLKRNRSTGAIELKHGPHSLTLGGKYQLILKLTKDDVLQLFAEAFQDDPLSALIAKLAKMFPGQEEAA